MAGPEESRPSDAPGAAQPSQATSDAAASSSKADAAGKGRNFKNSRQGGFKRGREGKERGRGDWQRNKGDKRKANEDYREQKRRKTNKDGEEYIVTKANPFSKEEIEAESRRPKRKVAVMIGYSGTGYRGMQVNGDEPTIERDLFRAFVAAGAISKANADDPKKSSLVRCARTDKGVHAAGNVISLKLIIEEDDIIEKINDALPGQIRVWGIERTNNAFSCYQGCDSRWYEYLMPSYCLLPPHPQTYLGKKIPELAKQYGAEEELAARMADVKDFWAEVEEKEIKPLLETFDPELRAAVLERIHSGEDLSAPDNEATSAKAAAEETENGETKEAAQSQDGADVSDQQAEAPKANSTVESVQPKKRELGPLDFALRDVKQVYVNAKRRYRVTPERLERLQAALDMYKGTRNFHNYTVQKAFKDPSAKRHIKSFEVNKTPIIINDTEWLSLKVHGQSFMMHQIRKMVGLASLVVRCGTPLDRISQSYQAQKMAIPKAPGLGLLLERPVFDNYNERATSSLGKETIDFSKYEEKLEAFKNEHIYQRIFDVEEKESAFYTFFNQIDQFKQNHFLWVTAGGMEVAQIVRGVQAEVDKQLGDEDEDPEGGDG